MVVMQGLKGLKKDKKTFAQRTSRHNSAIGGLHSSAMDSEKVVTLLGLGGLNLNPDGRKDPGRDCRFYFAAVEGYSTKRSLPTYPSPNEEVSS